MRNIKVTIPKLKFYSIYRTQKDLLKRFLKNLSLFYLSHAPTTIFIIKSCSQANTDNLVTRTIKNKFYDHERRTKKVNHYETEPIILVDFFLNFLANNTTSAQINLSSLISPKLLSQTEFLIFKHNNLKNKFRPK